MTKIINAEEFIQIAKWEDKRKKYETELRNH